MAEFTYQSLYYTMLIMMVLPSDEIKYLLVVLCGSAPSPPPTSN